jgi:hypothetical protein
MENQFFKNVTHVPPKKNYKLEKKHQSYYSYKGGKRKRCSLLPLGLTLEQISFWKLMQLEEFTYITLKRSLQVACYKFYNIFLASEI